MQGSALYDPRANATPSQLDAAALRRARLERMDDHSKSGVGIVPVSTSRRAESVASRQESAAQAMPEAFPLEHACSPTDRRLTFETFVHGNSNALAVEAARHMMDWDEMPFNPLVVYARSGLGKTHLLSAIRQGRPAVYMTASRFASFVAGRDAEDIFAPAKIVLIDDIHCLSNKTAFAALNALIDSGKRIVVTSDRPPIDLDVNDRLRTRLSSGLLVEMRDFSGTMRVDIVRNRVLSIASDKPTFAVDDSVINLIADSIDNGRQVDGAVNILLAHHLVTGEEITLDNASGQLKGFLADSERLRKYKIVDIQRVVARRYNVPLSDLSSARRTANIIRPRQLAMYLSKVLTLKSLPEVGRHFGGRDHTTILHSVRKIEGMIPNDPGLAQELDDIKLELGRR